MKRKARPSSSVAIIGTGLIGASIGLALRRAATNVRVIGYDQAPVSARRARRGGALTSVAPTLEAAIETADTVVLAVPFKAVVALLPRVLKRANPRSLVIDVAGLKSDVLKTAAPLLRKKPCARFVGGHPLAGQERAGPAAATASLFDGRPFALCVPRQTGQPAALSRARSFVRSLGAVPVLMSARDHDRHIAVTSALPQIVASATALAAADLLQEPSGLVGPGFDSVTRLARSPAALWTHGLLANKRNVIPALHTLERQVRNFRKAIERYDDVQLARLLRRAAAAQRRLKSS